VIWFGQILSKMKWEIYLKINYLFLMIKGIALSIMAALILENF